MQSCTRHSEKPIQYPVDVSDSFVSQTPLSGHLSGRKAGTPLHPQPDSGGHLESKCGRVLSAYELLGLQRNCSEPGKKPGISDPSSRPSKSPPWDTVPKLTSLELLLGARYGTQFVDSSGCNPKGRFCYHFHFTEKKTEPQKGKSLTQVHTARKWQNQDSNLDPSDAKGSTHWLHLQL